MGEKYVRIVQLHGKHGCVCYGYELAMFVIVFLGNAGQQWESSYWTQDVPQCLSRMSDRKLALVTSVTEVFGLMC